jgi:hypothetical protein
LESGAFLDASGHLVHPASGELPIDWITAPRTFGPDGSAYFLYCPASPESSDCGPDLVAFSRDGSLRYRKALDERASLLPGPAGTLYLSTGDSFTLLNADGSERFSAPPDLCFGPWDDLVSGEGAVYSLCPAGYSGDSSHVDVFDPETTSWASSDRWDWMAMGADGTLVAWRVDVAGQNDESNGRVTAIHLAVLGRDAQPTSGWPVTITGAASDPVLGAAGTVYLSRFGGASQPDELLALASGKPLSGWPASLPASHRHIPNDVDSPYRPIDPVLGANGTVYLLTKKDAQQSVIAFDPAGQVRTGWPVALSRGVVSLDRMCDYAGCYWYKDLIFAPSGTNGGLLYLYLGHEILALREDGQAAPGWPKELPESPGLASGVSWWAAMPDGGLAALEWEQHGPGEEDYWNMTLTRWAPDGSLAK